MSHLPNLERLRHFVLAFGRLLDGKPEEAELLRQGQPLFEALISVDDWLPDAFAQPHPRRYQQYLLHADSCERFSVVALVWGPGQSTPIHDHRTWGLFGVLRGAERSQNYVEVADASILRGWRVMPRGEAAIRSAGAVETISPVLGDIQRAGNAYDDRVSVSIHVHGGNPVFLRRSIYEEDGSVRPFRCSYANPWLPNIWALQRHGGARQSLQRTA